MKELYAEKLSCLTGCNSSQSLEAFLRLRRRGNESDNPAEYERQLIEVIKEIMAEDKQKVTGGVR